MLPAQRRRLVAMAMSRSLATVVLIVALYYLLPYDHIGSAGAVVAVIAGLAALALVLVFEFKAVVGATYPGVRAVEALAVIVPTFLVLFASLYYLLDRADRANFSQHLSRTGSLYFTVTTFSTVGYGDITPTTDGARVAVMFQMVCDLIVIGLGIKALFQAVQVGRGRRSSRDQLGSPAGRQSARPTSGC